MANYCCAVRTNYFRVKDPTAFKKFMDTVVACEDEVYVWEDTDKEGRPIFGFGCYSSILGVPLNEKDEDEEYGYDEFINGLSEHVAEDDAAIIFESGNEKLRYLVGSASVVTNTQSEYLDIAVIAAETAAKMLGNPSWETRVAY